MSNFFNDSDLKLDSDGVVITQSKEPDMTPLVHNPEYFTRVLLVRHGESLANAIHVFLGHTDLDLSERGYAQAHATAEFLRSEPISAIYSSDLIRAYNTAVPNSLIHGVPVITSHELREIHIGQWENMKIEDVAEQWGEVFTVGWKKQFGNFTPPGGECVADAAVRFYNKVMEIVKENVGKCILITAHAAVIRVFFAKVMGIAPEDVVAKVPFPDNASVSCVYYDGERLIPGEFSHSAHLVGI